MTAAWVLYRVIRGLLYFKDQRDTRRLISSVGDRQRPASCRALPLPDSHARRRYRPILSAMRSR
ncbi:MAG: hypothetical protein MZW92_33225 [Comamonadaceae bacterium]|nr:hypothetical protein [Comamonadaceae bacterium]